MGEILVYSLVVHLSEKVVMGREKRNSVNSDL